MSSRLYYVDRLVQIGQDGPLRLPFNGTLSPDEKRMLEQAADQVVANGSFRTWSVEGTAGWGLAVGGKTLVTPYLDIEAFKRALLSAATVAYIDPASGGSSGIYVAGLLKKLGIAEEIKPKERLQAGGYVGKPTDGDVLTMAQPLNGMTPDADHDALYSYLATELSRIGLVYLHRVSIKPTDAHHIHSCF